jgi:predicted nucleotidyltransferase
MDDVGLPGGCKDDVIAWAKGNGAVSELWLFGSRGPKGGAQAGSDLDIGIVLTPPKKANRDPAFGAYTDLGLVWEAELEAIVGRHVSLEPMRPGTDFDAKTRSSGTCLWRLQSPEASQYP